MSVIKNSITRVFSLKLFRLLIYLLCILTFVWWVLSGIVLMSNTMVLLKNSQLVSEDTSAIRVLNITEKGTLHLENTETIQGTTIKEYIRTCTGIDTYYIPEGKMSASLTLSDSVNLGIGFCLIELLLIVTSILVVYIRSEILNKINSVSIISLFSLVFILVSEVIKVYYLGIFSYVLEDRQLNCIMMVIYLIPISLWVLCMTLVPSISEDEEN